MSTLRPQSYTRAVLAAGTLPRTPDISTEASARRTHLLEVLATKLPPGQHGDVGVGRKVGRVDGRWTKGRTGPGKGGVGGRVCC